MTDQTPTTNRHAPSRVSDHCFANFRTNTQQDTNTVTWHA